MDISDLLKLSYFDVKTTMRRCPARPTVTSYCFSPTLCVNGALHICVWVSLMSTSKLINPQVLQSQAQCQYHWQIFQLLSLAKSEVGCTPPQGRYLTINWSIGLNCNYIYIYIKSHHDVNPCCVTQIHSPYEINHRNYSVGGKWLLIGCCTVINPRLLWSVVNMWGCINHKG